MLYGTLLCRRLVCIWSGDFSMKFATIGNALFFVGAALEIVGIEAGVHTSVVGASLIIYGVAMIIRGYLP
jgi:hypothetical protein